LEHAAVDGVIQGGVADPAVESASEVDVGLREHLVLEGVEVDAAIAVLVDDALEETCFLCANVFKVALEVYLQVCPCDVREATFVQAVESFFDSLVRVVCQIKAVVLCMGICFC